MSDIVETVDGRDMSGETVLGMRVAAYREPVKRPPNIRADNWVAFAPKGVGNRYSEHWSTPGEDAERLFTEASVRQALAAKEAEITRLRSLVEEAKRVVAAIYDPLSWAQRLAEIAMEDHRVNRVKFGHSNIIGTYRSGTTYVGISQAEVDQIEASRDAVEAARSLIDKLKCEA